MKSEITEFLSFLDTVDSQEVSEMLSSRVIPSFMQSLLRFDILEFSEDALKYWLIDMILQGFKASTVRRYFGALHTLYDQWADSTGNVAREVSFDIAWQHYCKDEYPSRLEEDYHNLDEIRVITATYRQTQRHDLVIKYAFQYLLFHPEASLSDIAELKFSDIEVDNDHTSEIVTAMKNAPQAKYVFPIGQGKKRPGALLHDLISDLHAAGKRAGLTFGTSFSRESITAIWVAAALKEGIPIGDILACVPNLPPEFSCLSLIGISSLSAEERRDVIARVDDAICDKSPSWFVMRLRAGISPEIIKEALAEYNNPYFRQIQFYYPMQTLKRIENKKVVSMEVPVLPGILFFRLQYDKVAPLMAMIGDKAWCYRASANPSSPYSAISRKEMKIFQRCMGAYTADIEMDIVAEQPALEVGDEVIIEDGSMLDGQMATIRKVRSMDGTVTYTLRLSDTAYLRWKDIALPASHISKA